MNMWPTDSDVHRALTALNRARPGLPGISNEAMRKALIVGRYAVDEVPHAPTCECAACWEKMEGYAK